MRKWLRRAFEIAENSEHSKHKMAAIVYRNGAFISGAYNTGLPGEHAEKRAVRPNTPNGSYEGATLLIVRSNGGCSRPCAECMKAIVKSGIDRIVYYNWAGELVKERVWP